MSVFSNIKDAVVPVLHCTVIEIQSCVYFLWSVSGYLLWITVGVQQPTCVYICICANNDVFLLKHIYVGSWKVAIYPWYLFYYHTLLKFGICMHYVFLTWVSHVHIAELKQKDCIECDGIIYRVVHVDTHLVKPLLSELQLPYEHPSATTCISLHVKCAWDIVHAYTVHVYAKRK